MPEKLHYIFDLRAPQSPAKPLQDLIVLKKNAAHCRRWARPNIEGRDVTGDSHYEDIAAHIQATTSDFLVRLVRFLDARFPAKHLCYSGGVALNGIANERLIRAIEHCVHMNGSCEDNGTAIGAALAVYHHLTGRRVAEEVTEHYGRTYSDEEIARALGPIL